MATSSSPSSPLSALAIFKNTLNQELMRSVHVEGDGEERWVEREYLSSSSTSFLEIRAADLDPAGEERQRRRRAPRFREGETVGVWVCVLAFDAAAPAASSSSIASVLSFLRNPTLQSIPTLTGDLQRVLHLMSRTETEEPVHTVSEEFYGEKEDESSLSSGKVSPSCEDQVSHACSAVERLISENQQNAQLGPEVGESLKKRRAATEHVANIALSDLAKYFNLPITEASRNLKVGLTVLKRKCREFGIPRWPHRKIKSLDTLIHDLQEEVSRQQRDNKAAAVRAATKRQRMLENEKEGIERSPFVELQGETKRFRQDVFKRRHKDKALSRKHQQPFPQDHMSCGGGRLQNC